MASRTPLTLDQLRRYAVARTLFPATTLDAAVARLGFVQADPIRAPARAQDLTLRHRVVDYREGELARRYPSLAIEEGYFINYGFLPRARYALLLPRAPRRRRTPRVRRHAEALLAYVRERGVVHPREVDAHFAHGTVRNYWGGSSSATTHLLEALHYEGALRVVARERGIRLYGSYDAEPPARDAATRRAQLDALVDLVVHKYAPLPRLSLSGLVHRIRFRTPARVGELRAAVARARDRLDHVRLDGVDWYFPQGDAPETAPEPEPERVRLLAPFDPLVWDRRRFELLWGWAYRFEAYTPAPKRKLGYYALPLLFGDRVIGWANVSTKAGRLDCQIGFVERRPRSPRFTRGLEAELAALRAFLGTEEPEPASDPP